MARSVDIMPVLGQKLPCWTPPGPPVPHPMTGRFVEIAPLNVGAHAADLFRSYRGHDQVWDYLPYGPFHDPEQYSGWVSEAAGSIECQFYAVRIQAIPGWHGVASYLRITPQSGSIEVGHLNFSPSLQRTAAATEAMYLMMQRAFDLGYRRYEWKCDALNIPSRRAAQRLGFNFEGIFRQATVVKGRNRDTAWFSVSNQEWPDLKAVFEFWLSDENMAQDGPRKRLSELTAPIRVARDPDV